PFDRTGRSWGFNYQVSGRGEDFAARSGFVPRSGIMTAHAFNRLSWYGAEGALLETGSVFARIGRLWRHGRFGDGAIEGDEGADFVLRFRGGWRANVDIAHAFVELDPADYTGYETTTATGLAPYAPLDRVSGPELGVEIGTPTFQRFNASVSLERSRTAIFPEGSQGTELGVGGSLALRPAPWARIAAGAQLERITRERD